MVIETESLENIAEALRHQRRVTLGKWFGRRCLKVESRVFAIRLEEAMVFKLPQEALSEALEIEGAVLFDPRGTGHPMKQWVQVPANAADNWRTYSGLACEYVAEAAEAAKAEIISGLVHVRARILEAAEELAPGQRGRVFLGEWSVKELLAHLIGWDYTNQEAVQDILAGRKPRFWDHYDRDWKSYNADLVARYGRDDWAELTAAALKSHSDLIGFLQNVPADEYVKQRKIVSLLKVEIKDEKTHHQQIVRFGQGPG